MLRIGLHRRKAETQAAATCPIEIVMAPNADGAARGAWALSLILLCACTNHAQTERGFVSQQGSTHIKLIGNPDRPRLPFVENVLDVELRYRDWPQAQSFELYRADFMDEGFVDRYADPVWLNESTIKFARRNLRPGSEADELTVTNQTSRPIDYVRVSASDLLILVNAAPGMTATYEVGRSGSSDNDYVSVGGRYHDGIPIPQTSANFSRDWDDVTPRRYVVVIRDPAVSVSSERPPAKQ